VAYEGCKGKSKTFVQRGRARRLCTAVWSPTLLVYINDVARVVPQKVEISMFADHIALWSSGRDVDGATQRVQEACEAVNTWSKQWLMELSIAKCEVALFSMDAAQANLEPQISVDGRQFGFNRFPTFLGVTYDRRLTFSEHVRRVVKKVRGRNRILSALAGTDWGYEKELLRTTYIAMFGSVIEYGSPAWMPWVTATDLKELEMVQREAARKITGALRSTQSYAVMAEADLPLIAA
jgi:hypothetical protein